MKNLLLVSVPILLAIGCSKSASTSPDAGSDLAVTPDASADAAPASDAATSDANETGDMAPPTFEVLASQPSTEQLGARRNYRVARGIIHAHNVHSHDACDGEPELEDGSPNEPCHDDFRTAICTTRQDYIFLTDHEELAATKDFETLMMQREGDVLVMEDGMPVANRITCDNGHEALLLPGGEFGVMPVGLKRHLAGTVEERDAAYNEVTPERVQSLRDAGAVVLQAHTEQQDRDQLRELGLDGFEVYQLHANVAPDIREEWLGLTGNGFITGVTPFVQGAGGHPDLMFMAFVAPNEPSIAHFDALVSEGQHLTGTGGTDCHQNVLKIKGPDNERIDSYRRMMRWFSNHLLVEDLSPASLRQALLDGRNAIVFEVLGTPDGFDFRIDVGGEVREMGESASLSESPVIHLARPEVLDWGPVPVRLEILKIEADGAVQVAEGEEALEFTPTEAGAYRAVVHITPTYLRPSLTDFTAEFADREYEWVWANPVYITP